LTVNLSHPAPAPVSTDARSTPPISAGGEPIKPEGGQTTFADADRRVTTGSAEKTKRQQQLEEAEKRRVHKAIAAMEGLRDGFEHFDLARVLACADVEEMKYWLKASQRFRHLIRKSFELEAERELETGSRRERE
jgi:hypothetical protein